MMTKAKRDKLFKVRVEGETIELNITREMFPNLSKKKAKKKAKKIRRIYWRESKKQERETRCIAPSGKARCTGDCSKCNKERTGVPLSLDFMRENGKLLYDSFSVEANIERMELYHILYNAIDALGVQDRKIIILHYMEGYPERKIAEIIGMSQSGVNYRKRKALEALKVKILKKISVDF